MLRTWYAAGIAELKGQSGQWRISVPLVDVLQS